MNADKPDFTIEVDVTNPGQFFACCGLLELADRLWPGAEAWFIEDAGARFAVRTPDGTASALEISTALCQCQLRDEYSDQKDLMAEQGQSPQLSEKDLDKLRREGYIFIGPPFCVRLDWWKEGQGLKTWSGSQGVVRIAQAAMRKFHKAFEDPSPLDYKCILRPANEEVSESEVVTGRRRKRSKGKDKVEPFYFDARRFAHALDTGFSLDAVGAETVASPATELLCLIGLQRFRPRLANDLFAYWTWSRSLPANVASAVVCGALRIARTRGYRFALAFRDDQKRYKAFSFATPI